VQIGKFDILATFTYAKCLLHGLSDDDAKQRGMVAAIMGAQGRLGHLTNKTADDDFENAKELAEKKKKTTITAEAFDHQVAAKIGPYFKQVFLPTMTKLVKAGLDYNDVKRAVKISTTWGAKINGDDFVQRSTAYLKISTRSRSSPAEE
jgi:hypothetical protein